MYWNDENLLKGKVANNSAISEIQEKPHQSDCRFIPNRRGTNNPYNQYLLKENINTSNILPTNGGCQSSQMSGTSFWGTSSISTDTSSNNLSSVHYGTSNTTNNGFTQPNPINNNVDGRINHQPQQQSQSEQQNYSYNNSQQQQQQEQSYQQEQVSYQQQGRSGNTSFTSVVSTNNGSSVVVQGGANINNSNHNLDNYHKLLVDHLFQEKQNKKKRVLNFKKEYDQPISLNKCLSKNFESANQTCNEQKNFRYISPLPERILDAPSLNDDYYLNLMDWGDCGSTNKGTLAICLGGEVYLWNENEIVNLLKTPQDSNISATSVSWMNLKNKNCLAVGFSDNTIQLWDTEKCIPYRILRGHTGRVSSLSWNNYILSSGSRDTSIINHDIRQKQNIICKFEGHEQEVCGLKWSPDGSQLASGGNDNTLRIWDINYGQYNTNNNNNSMYGSSNNYQRACFTHHKAAVKALAWCPWQKNLLASGGGTQDKTIKFWNTDKMELTNSINCGSQVCSILWNPLDKELVSSHGFTDNQLIVWSYPTMQKITELRGHQNRVLHMSLSPDGSTVCSASSDETLRFWKVFSGSQYDRNDYDDQNPYIKHKRDGPFSQNLFIR